MDGVKPSAAVMKRTQYHAGGRSDRTKAMAAESAPKPSSFRV